jgi:hypothetical protein
MNKKGKKAEKNEGGGEAYEGFEVDWFRLETRVRDMLSGSLQEIIRGLEENGVLIVSYWVGRISGNFWKFG